MVDEFSQDHDSCGVGFVANILGYKSHDILEKAIEAVTNLTHRGAVSADGKTGDGAGVLTQLPRKLFLPELDRNGFSPTEEGDLAVMMVFLPQEDFIRERCRRIIEERVEKHRLKNFGWRKVPVSPEALGKKALQSQPVIEQLLVGRAGPIPKNEFERILFIVRKEVEAIALEHSFDDLYIPSFSSRTIVYKGLLVSPQLAEFYLDLKNPDYETALALYHQRFSTNTSPTWPLAQPFRLLGHNGEINTISGNRNWMRAREPEFLELPWARHNLLLRPLIQPRGSDSASLDNAMEATIIGGRNLLETVAMMIPEAWEKSEMPPDQRTFYEFSSNFAEPWDGPAALAFSDGRIVGATLDRNGLRPSRYIVTDDDLIIMGSEVGVIDLDEAHVIKKGRLGPGMMIAIDTESGKLLGNAEIKSSIVRRNPYKRWIDDNRRSLIGARAPFGYRFAVASKESLKRRQRIFGLTEEENQLVIRAMSAEAKDPVFSMGDDTPLAVLSEKPRRIYSYFKQLFAQVTNPPIDPIREEMVMSLRTYLGARGNYFFETPDHARRLLLHSPILLPAEFESLKESKDHDFQPTVLPTLLPVSDGAEGIEDALVDLCEAASAAVDKGKTILILSDEGTDKSHAPIPMLSAVAAVHHHLIREGKRMRASIVASVGDSFDIHHFACLIGYGAEAIYPYLVYETLAEQIEKKYLPNLDLEAAARRFKNAVDHGLLKIMSKMGISTLSSYHGAQIFEAIGLKKGTIKRYFTGTPSKVGGIGLTEIARDTLKWHQDAFEAKADVLPLGGYYRFRRGEEYHAFNPDVVKAIHAYVKSGDFADFQKYAELVNGRPPVSLHDLLDFKPGSPIPINEVESIEEIRKRFTTASISYGALSLIAHETLAIAMNRIGAKSGSGEGGEDPARYKPLPNGDSKNSAIKQVASARFGVTTEYLMSAKELEIKMAQGSKPGEGGQLPGHKVSPEIARVRHAQPGVTLISPPPHHDIYSIEDLKQLIYDLKQVNPEARIGVKLVSENGVGTIAAGVAKAHADTILISGHEGGTGASPMSSIKNAGSAWELGLTETQQTLVANDLRGKVLLRVDGGMKTGRDVVMAALMGAEEYGFGTAALVAEGCIMARQCHLNTCPVGVTTHDPKLIAKYTGTPERVINFFNGIAQEVRSILAGLGFRSLDEIIGRIDLLKSKEPISNQKAIQLDLAPILIDVDPDHKKARRRIDERNVPIDWVKESLEEKILRDASDAIEGKRSVKLKYRIRNVHRTVGARVAGRIAKKCGDVGLPPKIELECSFTGSAGQSFGAFLVPGMRLILEGEANDYVGKGMTGGDIAIRPSRKAKFEPSENVIAGNTILYGATGGALYMAGRAGERFCVRNSGATAVVEGVGDHGCEYMTGGQVVVLGPTGRNFGAGMSGGVAYVLDEEKTFEKLYNGELIVISKVAPEDEKTLRAMIERHFELTQSPLAKKILKAWHRYVPLFWKAHPKDLAVVQHLTAAAGETEEPAEEAIPLKA